jgi:phosphatidylglycerol lysyltransferase
LPTPRQKDCEEKADAAERSLLERIDWSAVGALVALAAFSYAAAILYKNLENISWQQVHHTIVTFPVSRLVLAALATAVSYLALIGYDFIALRLVGADRVPLRVTAITSFISHAVTFTLGFGVLTGGAVRMRLYRAWDVKTDQVLAVVVLCALSFWAGLAAIAGICLTLDPQLVAELIHLNATACRLLGLAILAALAVWLTVAATKPAVIDIRNWRLPLPGARTTLAAILVGMVDVAAAAAALWILMPNELNVTLPGFLVVFSLATVVGVISHVPGGFGVFDAIVLLGAAKGAPSPELVSSLLLFRIVYYIVPVSIAAAMLVIYEMQATPGDAHEDSSPSATLFEPIIPPLAAIATFFGGLVLLIAGTLPAQRMSIVRDFVPLPFVEASHFIASLVGAILLIVANGLAHRLRSAWQLALVLLGGGVIFSVTKGFNFGQALICLAVAALLIGGRREFYRQGGAFSGRPSASSLLAVAVAVGASAFIGLAIYRGVPYDNSLWWEFAYHQDASRFLRATLGAATIAVVIAAYQLLHKTAPERRAVSPLEMLEVEAIVRASKQITSELAFTGDKQFLFSQSGDAFVMYGVRGSTWIAMGDPIAEKSADFIDLVWRFKENADEHRGTPVFYQVAAEHLPVYLDAGFSLIKLGEDAWVDLEVFTLDGKVGRRLRQTRSRVERTGVSFEIIKAGNVETFLPALKRVSDAWLAVRGRREKGFSLGFWNEDYLCRHDVGIVRHDGRIVAFANVLRKPAASTASLDLMRHVPDAPESVMDYLVVMLLEQTKAEGYKWFNLGMAPLSGLPEHRLASRWARLAGLFFRYGDRLYNFEGVRIFKSKFKPEWRPKYLAYEQSLRLPQTLIDIAGLISSSPQRVAPARQRHEV